MIKYLLLLISGIANAASFIPDNSIFQRSLNNSVFASNSMMNLGIKTSVSSSALTITVTQADGITNPNSTYPVIASMRGSTGSVGNFAKRSVTSALTLTIPSGTTIGTRSGATEIIHLYLIDNNGTLELAVSVNSYTDLGMLATTTAISGGNTRNTIYSASARTSVPIRLIGELSSTQATAGTWNTQPSIAASLPVSYWQLTSNGSGTGQVIAASTVTDGSGGACTSTCTTDGTLSSSTSHTGTGNFTMSFATNLFSATPQCVCTSQRNSSGGNGECRFTVGGVTSSAGNIVTADGSTDEIFTVMCIGNK